MMSITPSFPSSKNLNQAMLSVSKSMKNLGDSVHSGYSNLPAVPSPSLPTLPTMPITMPEITVSRSVSGVGARLLGRSNSISSKKILERHSQVTNIFCSEMVGLDSIIEDFDQVLEDQGVVRVEIEDLLHSTCYDDLSGRVGKVVFSNDRSWQMIQFLDSFDMSGFKTWHKQKGAMMRDYEICWSHLPGSTDTQQAVTFKAVVTIHEGTSITDFLKVLKKIKNDSDVFSMALYGITGVEVAHEDLASSTKVNWDRQIPTLREQLSMELQCGWKEPHPASMLFLSSCLYQLKLKVNLAHEEEMALARAAKQSKQQQKEETVHGGCSLHVMRQSLTQRAETKNLDGSNDERRTSGGLKRRPRSSPSFQRSLSDAGDRPITDTTSSTRQPRRSRSKGSLPGLQRTQSDSGDVIDPSRRRTLANKRSGRRSSRNTSLQRVDSLSSPGDSLMLGVGRSYSDSGDHDIVPRRPTRKSLSPSSSSSEERRTVTASRASAAIYQMKAVASALDTSDGRGDDDHNSGAPRKRTVRRAASDCGDERIPRRRRTSSKNSLKNLAQEASRKAIAAIDDNDDLFSTSSPNGDHTTTTSSAWEEDRNRRRSAPLRSASDCGDDRYHQFYDRSTAATKRASKRSLSKPTRSAFAALVDDDSPAMISGNASPNNSSRPKPTRRTLIEPLDPTGTNEDGDTAKLKVMKKGSTSRKSEPALRRVLSDKPKQRRFSSDADDDQKDHTTSTTGLKTKNNKSRKSEPSLRRALSDKPKQRRFFPDADDDQKDHTTTTTGLKIKNHKSRKSEPSLRRVLSDNPKERRSTKRSPRRKSDPTSEMKKAAAAKQDAGDEDMAGIFCDDVLSDSDDEDQELTQEELRILRTSTAAASKSRGRPVTVAAVVPAAASSNSPMRNARWQSRSPVHSPTRSISPFAQTTASCQLLAASSSHHKHATSNDKNNTNNKKVDDLLYDSEYSLEMEEDDDDDDDELELMQLKELQLLTNSGTSAMSLNDLMAMRRTLDAAIASIGEANHRSELDDWKQSSAKSISSGDSGEGPDYDWERGVFCRSQHATPRAA